jgi:membrane protein required for colicin V production
MNLLDLGILVLLGLVVVRGYWRGLFQELAFLVGVVGGILVAAHTYLRLAQQFQPYIKEPSIAQGLAFFLVLVVVYWLTRLVAHLLQRILYHLYLDFFDRVLGAFFALVKGALILGFALMVLGVMLRPEPRLMKESRLVPHLLNFSHQAIALLPSDFKARLGEYLEKWQKPKLVPKGASLRKEDLGELEAGESLAPPRSGPPKMVETGRRR